MIEQFLGECCRVGANLQCMVSMQRAKHDDWCRENNAHKIGKLTFTKTLRERPFVVKGGTNNEMTVYGVAVK